ncbi:MAG: hypothetical protein ACRD1Y_01385 [Terriglobales bacterium]
MARHYVAFVLLGLMALPLGAQQKATPKPKGPKAGPVPDPIAVLYDQAKAALADVPAEAQPYDLLQIAMDEDIRHRSAAIADSQRAFRLALALAPPQDSSDAVGNWHKSIKTYVELEAVVMLTRDGEAGFEAAHQLARQADVPRDRLYTELIGAAEDTAMQNAGRVFPQDQGLLARTYGGIGYKPTRLKTPPTATPNYSVLELAHECQQGDGTFPFLGVGIALGSYRGSGQDMRPLVQLAYQAASGATTPLALHSAVFIFSAGHKFYPALDQQMESAAAEWLRHAQDAIQNAPATPSSPSAARQQYDAEVARETKADGNHVLELVKQIDADRGAALASQFSIFSTPARALMGPGIPIRSLTAGQRQQNADPQAALDHINQQPGSGDQNQAAKFKALVNLAIALAEKNPAPAAKAASEALDMMTDTMLADNMDRVALLALRMSQDMQQQAQAEALIQRCLDAAEKKAMDVEQTFDNASPTDQQNDAGDFEGPGAPEIRVFAYASQVDFDLAVQRASATSATDFKPMFLLRTAVGQEMLHPWWN